jgi:hypothetical protein
VTLGRLAVLQWVGLVLGGVIWFAYHIAGFGLTEATCDSAGWSINHDLWQTLMMAAAAVLVIGAGAAAIAVILGTSDTSYESEPPAGRIRFIALAAVTANVLFFVIIVLDGLGAIFNVACRQA